MSNIIKEIGGIIISPRATLEAISKKEDISGAFIVVLIASILSGISGILLDRPMSKMMTELLGIEIPPSEPISLLITFALIIIFSLITWVIVAGIFRLIASVFGGEGSYKKIIQLYGYVYAIIFVLSPLQTIILMIAFPIMPIHGIMAIMGIFGLIGIIWNLIISTFAISIAENISIIKAFFVLLISYIIFIILLVVMYFIFIILLVIIMMAFI